VNKDRETIIIVRKKRPHGHAHHGGAWKVAFADFMTAMFALFLVLWLVNQSSDVRAAIAGYFQDPLGRAEEFGSSILKGDGAQAANPRPIAEPQITDLRRDRLQRMGEQIKRRLSRSIEFRDLTPYIEIEVTDEGLRIQLLEDSAGVFFELGSAVPRPRAALLFAAIGNELATMPNGIMLDGYTDAAPYDLAEHYSNWELSADRANTTRRIMVAGGLPEAQIMQVRGHGERDLREPEHPRSPRNRRVTITMLLGPEDVTVDSLAASVPESGDSVP
jgi:chemotaxis protein MotB